MHERERNPNLVFVGMHGKPEVVGLALRKSLHNDPVIGWDEEIANRLAYEEGVRQVEYNLALAFGRAAVNATSNVYELFRPAQLLELAEGREYVLDIHDVPLDNRADFLEMGEKSAPYLLGIAVLLDIQNVVIVRGKKKLVGNNQRAAVIEMGRGENGELINRGVLRLRACMGKIAAGEVPVVNTGDFNYYEGVIEIETPDAEAWRLPEMAYIEPFGTLPPNVLQRLRDAGIALPPGRYVADYWNGQSSNPGRYFGSVLRRIQDPFGAVRTEPPQYQRRALVYR